MYVCLFAFNVYKKKKSINLCVSIYVSVCYILFYTVRSVMFRNRDGRTAAMPLFNCFSIH